MFGKKLLLQKATWQKAKRQKAREAAIFLLCRKPHSEKRTIFFYQRKDKQIFIEKITATQKKEDAFAISFDIFH